MKLKPLYIYLLGFAAFIVIIIFFAIKREDPVGAGGDIGKRMPADNIHQGMKEGMPGMGAMSEAFKKREADLKSALEKNPNDTLKLREYAEFMMMAHKPLESLKYLEQIAKLDPKRIDILLNMTYIYDIQGNLQKAEEMTNKVLSANRKHPAANFNLGVIMQKKGDAAKAKQIWESVIRNNPGTEIALKAKNAIDGMK